MDTTRGALYRFGINTDSLEVVLDGDYSTDLTKSPQGIITTIVSGCGEGYLNKYSPETGEISRVTGLPADLFDLKRKGSTNFVLGTQNQFQGTPVQLYIFGDDVTQVSEETATIIDLPRQFRANEFSVLNNGDFFLCDSYQGRCMVVTSDGKYKSVTPELLRGGVAHINMLNQSPDGIIYATISDKGIIPPGGIFEQNRYFVGINPETGETTYYFNYKATGDGSLMSLAQVPTPEGQGFVFNAGPLPQQIFYLSPSMFKKLAEGGYTLENMPAGESLADIKVDGEEILTPLMSRIDVDSWAIGAGYNPDNETISVTFASASAIYESSGPAPIP